ncbi:MAG TPA: ABC transporter permease [Terriglobia bacterium]|nr:ABC transporter permease [Terriglobia bacterium]
MSLRRQLAKIGALIWRRRAADDLSEEIRAHLALEERENRERGMPPEEAHYAALRRFGNVTQAQERSRDMWNWQWLETLLQDMRYGLRQLRRSPSFTLVVVLTLALGIGANTAIFTLINDVMLKMLPVKNPQELELLHWNARGDTGPVFHWLDGDTWKDGGLLVCPNFSYRTFEQIRSRNQAFSSVFAFKDLGRTNVIINGQAGLATAQLVSGDYFSGLGVPAILGRTITNSDDEQGAPAVAVVSYGYWQRALGGNPGVVGKGITINGVAFTIGGVTPPEFYGLSPGTAVDISVPLTIEPLVEPHWVQPGLSLLTAPDHWWLNIMGRLKPGITEQQAAAGLQVLFNQSITEGVKFSAGQEKNVPWLELTPGGKGLSSLRRQFSRPLFVLMGIVGLLLLIACANLASLLLVRAIVRQKEIAVRLSVGARRLRLVRQLLTESVLLAIAGGLAGLAFAYWGSGLLLAFMSPGNNSVVLDTRPDLSVLGFTAVACLLTGVMFGLAPALQGTHLDLVSALKPSARGWGQRGVKLGMAKSLVVAQAALSLVLLFGAGLFVRTLVNLNNVNVGFNRNNLLLFGIDPTQDGYKGARLADFYDRLQDRIAALPGVRSATTSLHPLLSGHLRTQTVSVPGSPHDGKGKDVYVLPVGAKFFATMQIPILLGRGLRPEDNEKAPKVSVVNRAFAHQFFGDRNAIGKQFNWGGADSHDRATIVGMVGDAKYSSLKLADPPTIYQPFRQTLDSIGAMNFEVRTAGDPAALIPAVRRIVHEFDKDLPLYNVKTQNEQIDELLVQERLFARLSSFFGLIGLLLAGVGLYGLISYSISRRTGEIGIRMALGAERSGILRMVLRETLLLASFGVVVGIPVTLAVAGLVSNQISDLLYGLTPIDLTVLLLSALLMVAVAGLAGFLPARRAAKVDPMVALRYE